MLAPKYRLCWLLVFISALSWGQNERPPVKMDAIEGDFVYHDLKEFDLKQVPDSLKEFRKKIQSDGKQGPAGYDRYYSLQSNSRGTREFTVLSLEAGSVNIGIVYLIEDSRGQYISSFEVAHVSMDPDSKSRGKFINDSTFERLFERRWGDDFERGVIYTRITTKIRTGGKLEETNDVLKIERRKTSRTELDSLDKLRDGNLEYTAKDGHVWKSRNTLLVDDWLSDHHVEHHINSSLDTLRAQADFYLYLADVYLEVWNGRSDELYSERKYQKMEYYRRTKHRFAEIVEGDFPKLDALMLEKCRKLGVETKHP